MGELVLVPITLEEARWFVSKNHRHSKAAHGWKFGVGVKYTDTPRTVENILGVGCAGKPIARHQDDGYTLEITRVCTPNTPNANSMIYGALMRAGRALGFTRFVTYTLKTESGASLRAVGFKLSHTMEGRIWQGLNIYRGKVYTRDMNPIIADRVCWIAV